MAQIPVDVVCLSGPLQALLVPGDAVILGVGQGVERLGVVIPALAQGLALGGHGEVHALSLIHIYRISSPCVAGLFRPQIYLTFGLTESEKSYILAHERQHIKNGDHIWKMLAWLIMCVHWFNAFLWPLFYRAFLSQVEDACDQRVLRQLVAGVFHLR